MSESEEANHKLSSLYSAYTDFKTTLTNMQNENKSGWLNESFVELMMILCK